MEKNIIFYSNHCPHSRNVLAILNQERIGVDLLRVCIDTNKIRLPSFITSVPTIYLTRSKQILTDGYLENWINTLREKKKSEKLAPYCTTNSGFSDKFSFLNGDHEVPNFNFTNLDDGNVRMNTPQMISHDKKGVMSKYDKLLQERGQLDQRTRRM